MSRINDRFLNCVLYLYPSKDAAMQGGPQGGTGFLYGIPVNKEANRYHVIVVTCRHLLTMKEVYLRINSSDGEYKIFKTISHDWTIDPTEDLAICALDLDETLRIGYVRQFHDTVTKDSHAGMDIGPGDDVFIIGKFSKHSGLQQNTPVVRFGNLAMMPFEPIYNESIGLETYCYLVDLRIQEGFSGSPVFVQYQFRFSKGKGNMLASGPWSGEHLLGISWGGFTTRESINYENSASLPGYGVRIHDGMACVIPVERIDSLVTKYLEGRGIRIGEDGKPKFGLSSSV